MTIKYGVPELPPLARMRDPMPWRVKPDVTRWAILVTWEVVGHGLCRRSGAKAGSLPAGSLAVRVGQPAVACMKRSKNARQRHFGERGETVLDALVEQVETTWRSPGGIG
jgi:hypothetical protein